MTTRSRGGTDTGCGEVVAVLQRQRRRSARGGVQVAKMGDVRERPADRPPRAGETGRAVLRAYRVVGDARGTYGRRLVRRSVFRTIRRW